MATNQMAPTGDRIFKLSVEAQRNVIAFATGVLTNHKQQTQMQSKMNAIDIAYARYKDPTVSVGDGVDPMPDANASCGNIFDSDDVTPPLVVSQVDSYTAYLADVFLSGYPLFPVVSNPSNKKYAEQLETLLDDHATLGGYVRQLLLFLRDGVKYNYSAIETEWDSIDQFNIVGDFENGVGKKVNRNKKYLTKIKRLNMRNVVRDTSVPVGDVAEHGDFAGYIEMISKMNLKKLLNKLSTSNEVYNADRAMAAGSVTNSYPSANYTQDPLISKYVTNMGIGRTGVNWDAYFEPTSNGNRNAVPYGTMYEKFTLYARIMPADFGIIAPQKNTPQIWKFVIINGTFVISAKRIISAYDYLPILFGQPMEDGMDLQTQSVGEGEIPFQNAAATLFNIRFAAARRAVSDRALFDPTYITSKDVNSKGPAPKIPVRIGPLANKKLSDVYHQLPFDSRGMENVIGDAQMIVNFSKELHGLNGPKQGQFQKGNKSVSEWTDTMAGSDNRLRLPAICLEHQTFSPLKSILALNLFQYGEDSVVVSQKSGDVITIDLAKLREQVLAFRIADGITPKAKLASTEAISGILTLISTSQLLQQAYGPMLPGMVAHLAQLQGVRGLEEYDPRFAQPAAPQGLAANGLQAPPMAPPMGAPPDPSMMQAPMPTPGIP